MYYRGLKPMIEVLIQNEPYRYVKMPDPLENGQPDYRIQKWNNHNAVSYYTSPSPRDRG